MVLLYPNMGLNLTRLPIHEKNTVPKVESQVSHETSWQSGLGFELRAGVELPTSPVVHTVLNIRAD